MRWKVDVAQISQSPKSTVIGLCVLALAAERGVHFDAQGQLAMSARDWFDVGCGVLTAVVSGVSQDAGRVRARGAGGPEVERVEGHEVPHEAQPVVRAEE